MSNYSDLVMQAIKERQTQRVPVLDTSAQQQALQTQLDKPSYDPNVGALAIAQAVQDAIASWGGIAPKRNFLQDVIANKTSDEQARTKASQELAGLKAQQAFSTDTAALLNQDKTIQGLQAVADIANKEEANRIARANANTKAASSSSALPSGLQTYEKGAIDQMTKSGYVPGSASSFNASEILKGLQEKIGANPNLSSANTLGESKSIGQAANTLRAQGAPEFLSNALMTADTLVGGTAKVDQRNLKSTIESVVLPKLKTIFSGATAVKEMEKFFETAYDPGASAETNIQKLDILLKKWQDQANQYENMSKQLSTTGHVVPATVSPSSGGQTVHMRHPTDGTVRAVPVEQRDAALNAGYKLVP